MSVYKKEEVLEKFIKHPIIPVFYHKDAEVANKIIKSCYDGGIRVFEFTDRGENAIDIFKQARQFINENCAGMVLGIGTIFTASVATMFIESGADFVVQPVLSKEVAEVCLERDVLWAPGAATANEVYQASIAGAEIVKLFPGNTLSPDFVKALKGPMPNIKLMVTGGVLPNIESIKTWFASGVTAVGIGSQLFPSELIDKGEFATITERITSLTALFKQEATTL